MSRNAIWWIIILMSSALMGIAIIQFFWIKWQIDLKENEFDQKVRIVQNNVRDLIHDDHDIREGKMKSFTDFGITDKKDKNKILLNKQVNKVIENTKNPYLRDRISKEISTLLNNPDNNLENINKDVLRAIMVDQMGRQGIDLAYDYGIYSNKNEAFNIINGHYAAPISGSSSSFEDLESRGLYNTPYKIDLFTKRKENPPGHLAIFFPNRTGYLWSKVWRSMLASLLFTGLILFCFSYTIYVILKQKKVSEMKTDFINNMTHEFKTPIATISLATDSITNKMTINDENKIKRFANIIKEENSRMLNQVEKVLQMAKIDKEDFKLNLVELDIHYLIEKAARNMSLKLDKRNGTITTKLKAANSFILGDQNHISNILHNLLDNAEKYSDKEPLIIVSTDSTNEGINITITDSGIGMSTDSLKSIFDKFYRVHTGNRHDVKGFGLGLSYVKALVTAHKGSVSVDSELGKGSSFKVFLPFKQ